MPKRKVTNSLYVNNKDFYNQLIISKEQDELTPEAVDMIYRICKRAINNLSYKYPEDREDGIQTAALKCFMYWKKFDPENYDNPFSYFTQICKNGYAESFKKLRIIKGPLKESDIISISHDDITLF